MDYFDGFRLNGWFGHWETWMEIIGIVAVVLLVIAVAQVGNRK